MILARVFIRLKPTVNDPQGETIRASLRQLGFDTVRGLRAGKYMEISLDEGSEDDAGRAVRAMCETLLANPLIEDYDYQLERVADAQTQ